jgi:hypothetical protein
MKKKKIILLSDDMRSMSGVATMSREIIVGTCLKFDWFQVGSMINHPEYGKLIDVSEDLNKMYNRDDINVRILAYNNYGDVPLLREILKNEKPDAILHFTDPHYWQWLYDVEHEIRQHVPILFYHVWDDTPDPIYNRDYYESCDWIGCISKQTFGIVNRVGKLDTSDTYNPLNDEQIDQLTPEEMKILLRGERDLNRQYKNYIDELHAKYLASEQKSFLLEEQSISIYNIYNYYF